MTDLKKPVRRRSQRAVDHHHRRLIVCLEPGDVLTMRLEGTRTAYRAPFQAVFRQLASWHAEAESRRRREERTARRAA